MSWFSGTEHKIVTIEADLEKVRAFFCDPVAFKAALPSVESATEIEKNVWQWTLFTKKEKGITFKGCYTVVYVPNETGVTWTTRQGNMESTGRVILSEKSDKTQLDYQETVKVDLPVPKLLAPVLKKVVGAEIKSDIQKFIASGVKLLEQP